MLTAGGGALAQTESIVGISTVTTYSANARIIAVDPRARTATFAFDNGTMTTSKVSPSFAGFNARKVGDTVSVAFEDSITLVLPGPGVPHHGGDGSATAAAGASKAAEGASNETWWLANWCVVGVDAAAAKISLIHPIGGQVLVYSVTTAEGRKHLPRVKTGDYLTGMDPRVQVISFAP